MTTSCSSKAYGEKVQATLNRVTERRVVNYDTRDPDGVNCALMPSKLESLEIGGNKITELPQDFELSRLTHLRSLCINHNQLASFNFSLLPAAVENLDLNNNQLTDADLQLMPQLLNLRRVDLSSNKLRTITGTFADSCPNLEHLSVDSNQLREFDFSIVPASVKQLSMSYNNIDVLRNAPSLSRLQVLVSLRFNGNPLVNIGLSVTLPSNLRRESAGVYRYSW